MFDAMSSFFEDSSDDLSEASKSKLLYKRSSEREKVLLEEFQLISVLGRGSFGKVFLVYL